MKGWAEKGIQKKYELQKISDNIKFSTKSFKQDKEKQFLMLKATIHHENLSYETICTK